MFSGTGRSKDKGEVFCVVSKETYFQKRSRDKRPQTLVCKDFYTGEVLGYNSFSNRERSGEECKVGFTTLQPTRKHRGRGAVQPNQWGSEEQGISRGFPKKRRLVPGRINNPVGGGTGNILYQGAGRGQDGQLDGRIQLRLAQQYRGKRNKPLRIIIRQQAVGRALLFSCWRSSQRAVSCGRNPVVQ